MPRMSAPERRKQFVAAAIRVMSREGLDRATTRRIAEEAQAPQATFHYVFSGKNELLRDVVVAITEQIGQVVQDAVVPERGLAAALADGLRAFWQYAISDDGLQLLQYELTVLARRTPGLEWLAERQYTRYVATAQDLFTAAAAHGEPSAIPIDDLARFVVAGVDGLIIQYEVHRDAGQSERDLQTLIRAATLLARTPQTDAIPVPNKTG